VLSEKGRLRQVFVPRNLEPTVRQWVAQYHEVRDLLEALARMHLDRLTRKDRDKGA
jgi:hypothetical protein